MSPRAQVGVSQKRSNSTSANGTSASPRQNGTKPMAKLKFQISGTANSPSHGLLPKSPRQEREPGRQRDRVEREHDAIGDVEPERKREQMRQKIVAPIGRGAA